MQESLYEQKKFAESLIENSAVTTLEELGEVLHAVIFGPRLS